MRKSRSSTRIDLLSSLTTAVRPAIESARILGADEAVELLEARIVALLDAEFDAEELAADDAELLDSPDFAELF